MKVSALTGWFCVVALLTFVCALTIKCEEQRKLIEDLRSKKDWAYRNMQVIERSNALQSVKLKEYESRDYDVLIQQLQGLVNDLQKRVGDLEKK